MNTTPTVDLIRAVRKIAEIGIVNARKDKPILEAAADLLEEMDERLAIVGEAGEVLITRKLTPQERDALWDAFSRNRPIYASIDRTGGAFTIQSVGPVPGTLDEEDKVFSGLIEEE